MWQKLEEDGGDLMAAVAVEGWLPLVDLDGFSDLAGEPLLFFVKDFDIF